jgi:hypothetical protein
VENDHKNLIVFFSKLNSNIADFYLSHKKLSLS